MDPRRPSASLLYSRPYNLAPFRAFPLPVLESSAGFYLRRTLPPYLPPWSQHRSTGHFGSSRKLLVSDSLPIFASASIFKLFRGYYIGSVNTPFEDSLLVQALADLGAFPS